MAALEIVAEPRRREILRLVWDHELCAGEIAECFDVTFGAVSQHLRVLREGGMLTLRREGRMRYYPAEKLHMGPLALVLEEHWRRSLHRLKASAEDDEGRAG